MKNESAFNAYLSRQFNALTPALKYLKVSDRFSVGVSDFIIWSKGKSLGLECKYIDDYPKTEVALLFKNHKFTGPQITFLKEMVMAGCYGYGLIAVGCEKKMYLIPPDDLIQVQYIKNGEWQRIKSKYWSFKIKDTNGMLLCALGEIPYE